MATFLSNRDGGKTNEEGHYRFQTKSFTGNVNNGLKVVQNNPLGMSVLVEKGDARIPYQEYGYTWWNDGNLSVSLNTADTSNPRDDVIVAYVDRGVTSDPNVTNNPDIVKIKAVAGSPSASPTPPNNTVIQTSVGAGNPFMILAQVRVGAGVSTISNGNITDKRVFASPVIANGAVTTDKIAPFSVIAYNTNFGGNYSLSEQNTGFTWIDGKQIYKKTINFGALPNSSEKLVNHNISNIDNIIDIEAWAKRTDQNNFFMLTRFGPNNNIGLAGANRVHVGIYAEGDRSNYNVCYVTLWYTKI